MGEHYKIGCPSGKHLDDGRCDCRETSALPDRNDGMTSDEARDLIIDAARMAVEYWSMGEHNKPDGSPYTCADRISGAIFTMLAELDGTGSLPACDIVLLHSDEKGNTGGETRVSTMLHEYFYRKPEET